MPSDESTFPPLKNDLFLRAAWGQKVERVPVWIMRQAGRYLPEFQEVRRQHEFFEICQQPELACKVTMQPLERFDLDAAIIFNDILVVPKALGMAVEIKSKVGIHLHDGNITPDQIFQLKWPKSGETLEGLAHVAEAISYTRRQLDGKVPLIGFSGGPWTLMTYMIEGGSSNTMSKAKKWLYETPDLATKLLRLLTDVIADYILLQIEAGAQAIQVFESNIGYLGPNLFQKFALPFLKLLNTTVKHAMQTRSNKVPLILYVKGAHSTLGDLGGSGYDVISIDWTVPPAEARKAIGPHVTLQGNLDPCALYADEEGIEELVTQMLQEFGTQKYIANLGHGIYPDVNPKHVSFFIRSVQKVSQCLSAS